MSRRRRAVKREIEPDPKYGSEVLTKFINKIMIGGKKSISRSIVYDALDQFARKVKSENPLMAFEQALENAKPSLEVKSRRIGGATYQVPIEISPSRRTPWQCAGLLSIRALNQVVPWKMRSQASS